MCVHLVLSFPFFQGVYKLERLTCEFSFVFQQIHAIITASRSVKNSAKLRKLLEIILAFGKCYEVQCFYNYLCLSIYFSICIYVLMFIHLCLSTVSTYICFGSSFFELPQGESFVRNVSTCSYQYTSTLHTPVLPLLHPASLKVSSSQHWYAESQACILIFHF